MSLAAIATVGSKAFTALSTGAKKMATDVGKSVNAQIGIMTSFNNALTSALEPLTLITEPIQYLGEIIGTGLYPLLQPFSDALYALGPIIEPLVQDLSAQLAPAMAQLAPIITMLAPPIIQVVGLVSGSFIPIITAIIPAVMAIVPVVVSLINAFMPLVPVLMPIFFPVLNLVQVFTAFTPILTAIIPYVTGFVDIIAGFMPVIANVISIVSPFFTNFWGTMLGFLLAGWQNVVNWFSTVPQQILNAITSAATNFGQDVKDWWNDLWN